MTDKNLFHTITIKIPSKMVYTTKTGLLKLVPTLTKTGNLTKREKEPSIIFQPDDFIIHPEVINTGSQITYPQPKTRKPRAKKGDNREKVEEELLPEEAKQIDIDEIIKELKEEEKEEEPDIKELGDIKQTEFVYSLNYFLKRINNINFFNYIYKQLTNNYFVEDLPTQKMINTLTKLIKENNITVKKFNNYITQYNTNKKISRHPL